MINDSATVAAAKFDASSEEVLVEVAYFTGSVRLGLACCLLKTGNYHESIQHIDAALAMRTSLPNVHVSRALYFKANALFKLFVISMEGKDKNPTVSSIGTLEQARDLCAQLLDLIADDVTCADGDQAVNLYITR